MATKKPRKTPATTKKKPGAAQRSGKSAPPKTAGAEAGKGTPKKPTIGVAKKKSAGAAGGAVAAVVRGPTPPRRPALRGDGDRPAGKFGPPGTLGPQKAGLVAKDGPAGKDGAAGSKGGAPPAARRMPRAELGRIRDLLDRKRRALKDHIQAELMELETPEKKHRSDLEEIASDTHDTDSLCEIMGMESIQIDQIERAIRQIDDGTYGICEDCGGEIPPVRLEALPFATQCVDCKRRAEIAGQISAASGG